MVLGRVTVRIQCKYFAYLALKHAFSRRDHSLAEPTRFPLCVRLFFKYIYKVACNKVCLRRTQGALQNILCSRLLFHVHAVNEFPDGTLARYSTHADTFLRSRLGQEMELTPRRGGGTAVTVTVSAPIITGQAALRLSVPI